MDLTASQEEYLKTIYIFEKMGKVRVTYIADKLKITKPSVNKAINNLKELKLVNYEAYGDITLTSRGQDLAKEVLRKQDVLATFLVDVLGVDEEDAEQEVNKMKHAVSENTIKKLDNYISKVFNLNCNYDLSSQKCKNCIKINKKVEKKGK